MRKLLPFVLAIVMAFIDTSVLGVLAGGWATPFCAFAGVIAIGLLLGRVSGMLCGLAAGFVIDVTVGYPMGLQSVIFLASGYLSGFAGRRYQRYILTPVVTPVLLTGGYEVIMTLYQFMAGRNTTMDDLYHALIRIAIQTVLVQGMYLLYNIILKPSWSRYAGR